MALDPIILAIRSSQQVTADVLERAKDHRINRINELWAEIRILDRLLDGLEEIRSAQEERDPPIETAERISH